MRADSVVCCGVLIVWCGVLCCTALEFQKTEKHAGRDSITVTAVGLRHNTSGHVLGALRTGIAAHTCMTVKPLVLLYTS